MLFFLPLTNIEISNINFLAFTNMEIQQYQLPPLLSEFQMSQYLHLHHHLLILLLRWGDIIMLFFLESFKCYQIFFFLV